MPLTAPDFVGFQEGKQASLAADFSITQFKHLGRLLMVHGRNSYKRSAALSQFVIHRSLCISTMQVGGRPAPLLRCVWLSWEKPGTRLCLGAVARSGQLVDLGLPQILPFRG